MNLAQEISLTIGKVTYYILEGMFLTLYPRSFRTEKSVKGEIVLVTGAGSGLGRLTSVRLAKLGANLVLWDVSGEGLAATKALIEKEGAEAHTFVCDITDRELVYKTAEKVRKDVGHVTILINNAGVVSGTNLLDTPDKKIQLTMDVNITAHFWTLKAFLPNMLQQKHGHIVTISSLAGKAASPGMADYAASKFAAVGLHAAMSEELRGTGVFTTNICPTFINTGMFTGAKARFPSLTPVLDQYAVAERIVKAMLLNEDEVNIPGFFVWANLLLKLIIPLKAHRAITDLLGQRELMSDFTGRNGVTTK